MHDFDYFAPDTLADAIALFAERPAESRYLAGGTDLFLAMEQPDSPVRRVIDLKGLRELCRIDLLTIGGWRVGALDHLAVCMDHPGLVSDHAVLDQSLEVVGGPAIRNRATIGGNLCNGSPAADTAGPLLAAGAVASVAGAAGKRTIPVADLWRGVGPTTLAPGDLLTAL